MLAKRNLRTVVRMIGMISAPLAALAWPGDAAAHGVPRAVARRAPRAASVARPYGELRGVVKKTIFGIEVARVVIRVDPRTQHRLAELVAGHERSRTLDDQVVRAVMQTDAAMITAELRRDVPFSRYVESAYGDLGRAWRAGLISDPAHRTLQGLLPLWFEALKSHGARKGDVFVCRVSADSMRVTYRTAKGTILADRSVQGHDAGRAVLASYVAPGSTFRKELLASLFR